MVRVLRFLVPAFVCGLLLGCGGDSKSTTPPPEAPGKDGVTKGGGAAPTPPPLPGLPKK